ncbi:hypothetical protein FVEG_02752 [Fusarium verticillioides 7600]|uniref:Uncharacterized protein n=1 Tax=Gibberella moniliformis (strain M3125 / FGSC 7600) TaxID=334819 RepID=W7LXT4_GIBM7|nr:hypothetical protein FVEG_02752 [Fusarium verticillioides 7600]EWG40300.1 hypothetical protein FVEG_02752 [Fusarium verticillioides 7600]
MTGPKGDVDYRRVSLTGYNAVPYNKCLAQQRQRVLLRLRTWECENGSILGQPTPYTGYESSTWGKVDVPGRDRKGQGEPALTVETSQAGNLLGLAYYQASMRSALTISEFEGFVWAGCRGEVWCGRGKAT